MDIRELSKFQPGACIHHIHPKESTHPSFLSPRPPRRLRDINKQYSNSISTLSVCFTLSYPLSKHTADERARSNLPDLVERVSFQ